MDENDSPNVYYLDSYIAGNLNEKLNALTDKYYKLMCKCVTYHKINSKGRRTFVKASKLYRKNVDIFMKLSYKNKRKVAFKMLEYLAIIMQCYI